MSVQLKNVHHDKFPQARQFSLRVAISYRCDKPVSECAQSAHAEEAGDPGELPAGGRRGPRAGGAGLPVSGRTNGNWAHPAASEPPAALCQPLGSGESPRLPVSRTRWVLAELTNH